jgi:crotonobetainyl-CoA:carnitine CoA-transferase CaiB-like acyl-CoA transferase
MVSLLTYVGQYYLLGGSVPGPIGSAHQSVVPYQAFATEDIYIVVAVFVEKFWHGFCKVLGLDELIDDPRFDDNDKRRQYREELIPILEDVFRTRPGDEWLRLLSEAGVPCSPINTLDRVFSEPQLAARDMVVETDHPAAGALRSIGNPVKASPSAEQSRAPAPLLGQHTEEILKDVLGYSRERISSLRGEGVIL